MITNSILIVDDEESLLDILSKVLKREKYKVEVASDGYEALEKLSIQQYNVALVDLKMPNMDGMELLDNIKERWPELTVIIMTAHGTIETAVEAMKQGAYDFVVKPFEMENLKQKLRMAIEREELIRENNRIEEDKDSYNYDINDFLIGKSTQMLEVYEHIKQVAPLTTRVLIRGESGTGKELVAKAIHYFSPRRKEPFITLNCAAVPETILESELFGHEKGAFTGAISRQIGKFELAHGGTLFLDEVGDMSLAMQAKLLRVLQENTFERVGGRDNIKVDVRVIAATNRDLEKAIGDKLFREDLFYRLNVFPIYIPSLRERKEDIPLLVKHCLSNINNKLGKNTKITEGAKKVLAEYLWPGNIRELENVIEHSVIRAVNGMIDKENLNLKYNALGNIGTEENEYLLKNVEKKLIIDVLNKTNGNRKKTADLLGLSLRTLQYKIKEIETLKRDME